MISFFQTDPFQNSCKIGPFAISLLFLGLGCASSPSADVEPVQFPNEDVSYSNESCAVEFVLVNSSGVDLSLGLLTASFVDDQDRTHDIQLEGDALAQAISPLNVPAGNQAEGAVTFDLSQTDLAPPLLGSLIVVGFKGATINHFAGTFTCN